jgi:tetratricopeptide (TPR) repeat protein
MSSKKSMAATTSTKSKAKGPRSETGKKSPAKKVGSKTTAKRASTSGKSKSTSSKGSSKPLAKAARKADSKSADLQAQLRLLTEKIASLEKNIQGADTASQSPSTPTEISPPAPVIRREKAIPVYEVKEVHPIDLEMSGSRNTGNHEDGFYVSLLDRARIQWLMGDWEGLSKIDLEQIQHHPDRTKLALLAFGAMLQTKPISEAKKVFALSKQWGAKSQALRQILVAGVHNSLSSIAALKQDSSRSQSHLKMANQCLGLPEVTAPYVATASSNLPQALPQKRLQAADSPPEAPIKFLKAPAGRKKSRFERGKYFNENGEKLFHQGNYKLAAEYFQRALDLVPNEAWFCQNLAEAVARLDFRKGEAWECEHLGATIEGAGKWDVAVRYYRLALELSRQTVEAHRQSQTFAISPTQTTQVSNPIFIVGCGHSGTSLLLAMLGTHKHLHPIPKESALFLKTDKGLELTMGEFDHDCLSAGKTAWIEKTPPHIFQIHRFLAFRPQSRILLILRDGRDVVCSLKHRQGYLPVQDRLERWIYDNLAAQSYWQHPNLHVVKYENLIENPEGTLRDICAFLDEEYDPAMLDFHKVERKWYAAEIARPPNIQSRSDHAAHRNWQINQPLFDGRGRWKSEMTDDEKQVFKNSPAQRLLEQFGYAANNDW